MPRGGQPAGARPVRRAPMAGPHEMLEILVRLAGARGEADVDEVLADRSLADARWKPLGGDDNNYATVSNQQSDPINALCEKPINSMDHVLLRKCREAGDDPESAAAPRTMREAVERYLGAPGGDVSGLDDAAQRRLAGSVVVAADGSRKRPNIAVADRGEGQHPDDFEDTLLSIHRGNKKKIKFVQGKYNMGGTGVLPFCGTKGYELIVSRRASTLADAGDWGFTLVRERPDVPDSYKTTWYEHLASPDGGILRVPGSPLDILPYGGPLEDGCYIKMFEYELPNPTMITNALWAALNARLYSPAMPFVVHESRTCFNIAKESLRTQIVRGNAARVRRDARDNVRRSLQIRPKLRGFGTRTIDITVFKHASQTSRARRGNPAKDFRDESEAVILTQNGQSHATLSLARLKTGTRLTSLAPYMMAHVDLTGIPPRMAKMFLASRDRARKSADFERLRDKIFEDLRDDNQLRALDAEYKLLDEKSSVRDESMDEAIRGLISRNRQIARLLDPGRIKAGAGRPGAAPGAGAAPTAAAGGGGGDDAGDGDPPGVSASEEFKPSDVPTYLRVRAGRSRQGREGLDHKMIPSGGRPAYVYFETDAPNGYTERGEGGGSLDVDHPEGIESTSHAPFNGIIKVKVAAKGDDYATSGGMTVTLTRPGDEPLTCVVQLHLGPDAPPAGGDSGREKEGRGRKGDGVSAPRFTWVTRDEWGTWGWDGATVSSADDENVRVNRNCTHLEEFKKGRKSADAERIDARFGLCVYLASVALHRSARDDERYEDIHGRAMTAVAMSCLSSSHDLTDEDVAGIVRASMARGAGGDEAAA